MKIDRRSFLRLMLASAAAEAVDFEKLLWVPKPMVVVPRMPTIGGIDRATFHFWRNQQVGAAWEAYVGDLVDNKIEDLVYRNNRLLNRDLFMDGSAPKGLLSVISGVTPETDGDWPDADDPDY